MSDRTVFDKLQDEMRRHLPPCVGVTIAPFSESGYVLTHFSMTSRASATPLAYDHHLEENELKYIFNLPNPGPLEEYIKVLAGFDPHLIEWADGGRERVQRYTFEVLVKLCRHQADLMPDPDELLKGRGT